MNELVDFLKKNRHCTSWPCTTCGGLWIFFGELSEWLEAQPVNLPQQLAELDPEELIGIRDWPVFMNLVLARLSEAEKGKLKEYWQPKLGQLHDFDRLAIHHFKPGSFNLALDSGWFNVYHDHLLSPRWNERQAEEIEECLRFLGSYVDRYPGLEERKQALADKRLAETLKWEQEANARKYQAEVEKQAWDVRLAQLANLQPRQRVGVILGETGIDLNRFPGEWAGLPDGVLNELSDTELHAWIAILKNRFNQHDKGPWRDLRSRLYLQRQKRSQEKYRKEKG